MKIPTRCAAVLLPFVLGPVAPLHAADASTGQALFDAQCASCHRSGARSLKTAPEALASVLASNSAIRAHRFQLGSAQIEDLAAYLRRLKGQAGSP